MVPGSEMRAIVADSWVRSSAAGVDPEQHVAPVVLAGDQVADYRSAHVLSRVFPLLYDVLGRAAVDCDAVMAVGDADGKLLWVCGAPAALRAADSINFVEGTEWTESSAGTNAPGMAIHLDAPASVHGQEHFNRLVHSISCAAAPIHDPVSRRILGVVDITGGPAVATAQSLAMVHAAARMAEAELGRLLAVGGGSLAGLSWGSPDASTFGYPARVRVSALGLPEAVIDVGGRSQRLSRRHSELLVALFGHPGGCTAEQLEVDVYPRGSGGSTLRVELGRLRALLGEDVLQSRPYRLAPELHADWLAVEAMLAAGRVSAALTAYQGPLLPGSEAPVVLAARESLEAQLRRAVLASGQPELMAVWTRSRWGTDDLEMWQALAATLPLTSPLRPVAQSHLLRLEESFGLGGATALTHPKRATSMQHRRS